MNKKLIVTLTILTFAISLVMAQAQFIPYGSAKMGLYYEMEDEDYSGVTDGTLNLNYHLAKTSIFGARYRDGDLSARVELGSEANVRLLWARYDFGSYRILVGQVETILDQRGSMTYNSDNQFIGWGALFDGRVPQVRLEMNNGLALGLVQPVLQDLKNYPAMSREKSILLPKINLGYKTEFADNMALAAALGLNMYSYDEAQGALDETVMSFVAGIMLDMDFDPIHIKLHGNFGQNTGNYGLPSQTYNTAIWNAADQEIVAVTTMGGFGELSYKLNDHSQVTVGGSFTMSDSDLFDEADTAMAAFGQFKHRLGKKFWVIPEAGLLNNMQNAAGVDEGSMMYFGMQLRMDF